MDAQDIQRVHLGFRAAIVEWFPSLLPATVRSKRRKRCEDIVTPVG